MTPFISPDVSKLKVAEAQRIKKRHEISVHQLEKLMDTVCDFKHFFFEDKVKIEILSKI